MICNDSSALAYRRSRLPTGVNRLCLVLLACCGLTGFSFSVFAATDRLALPALQSPLASRSLLLDITEQQGLICAVGERGHILVADVSDRQWQQGQVPVSVTLTAVEFADSRNGWAAGHDGVILATSDGGRSWRKQLDGFQLNGMVLSHYQRLLEQAERRLQLSAAGNAGNDELEERLELLELAVEDAEVAVEEGPTKPFLDLLFVSPRHGWAIGAYGLLLETDDGGHSWVPRMERLDNPDGFHLNVMLQSRDGALFIAGEAGVLFRSTDLGHSWQLLDSPYEGSFYGLTEIAPEGGLLVTGLRGRGFRSDDGGDSWRALDMATRSTLNDIVQLSGGELVSAGNGGVLVIGDAEGEHFRQRTEPGLQSYSALVSAGPQLILVGQGGISERSLRQLKEGLQ